MGPEGYDFLLYRPVTLVLRIVHWDKAGETCDARVVQAEVADVTADGSALLVIDGRIPFTIPAVNLYPVGPTDTAIEAQTFIAGHELLRDFHPQVGEPRTVQRWLSRQETEELLAHCRDD